VGIVALSLYAVLMLWGGVVATIPRTFAIAFTRHGVLDGAFITATASLGPRLFPPAKFAQFASALGIVIAFGYMLLPPALGAMLDWNGHVYRHTFVASGVLAALGVGAMLVVHAKFMKLGGTTAYVAPQ
jgi:MFS family permease